MSAHIMCEQNDARQFPGAEWDQDAAAGAYPVAQRFRQRVSERLVERHGQADVAITGRSGAIRGNRRGGWHGFIFTVAWWAMRDSGEFE